MVKGLHNTLSEPLRVRRVVIKLLNHSHRGCTYGQEWDPQCEEWDQSVQGTCEHLGVQELLLVQFIEFLSTAGTCPLGKWNVHPGISVAVQSAELDNTMMMDIEEELEEDEMEESKLGKR
ncbi:hypothetical protein EDD15DRAFT_2192091 [Pisolithus albus]|nr:hypothetical protein EDD15DRAFT_2192091 [Pisolithus albus]